MKMLVRSSLFALALVGCAGAVFAQDPAAKPAEPMDEKKMMEMMAQMSAPDANHKWLEGMTGTWDAKVISWPTPGAPPNESSGTSVNTMILGGRFLEQKFEGAFMDTKFTGLGYTGYDKMKKQFVGTWMDNFGTGVMVMYGTADAGGKTLAMSGQMEDPMTGKTVTTKSALKIVDPGHHVYEMWGPAPDGKEHKMMEIHYMKRQ